MHIMLQQHFTQQRPFGTQPGSELQLSVKENTVFVIRFPKCQFKLDTDVLPNRFE